MTARTYVDDLTERLAAAGARTVLRHGDLDVSGDELLAAVHRYAHALDGLGIGRGDVVALYAPNRPDALAVRYATHLLGAASVFLSAPPERLKRGRMLVDFTPRLVVVWPETLELLPDTEAEVASVGAIEGVELRLDRLAAAGPATVVASRARPDDLAVIISSGGTTGVPKGSVRDFATWSRSVTRSSPPDRRQLANGKLAYLTQLLVDMTLLGGGTVVLQDRVDPVDTLAAIETERITDLFLVEPQLVELMDHPALGDHDLSSLRALTHIGAAAAPVLRRRARARLGPVLAHVYGASEMGLVSALGAAEHDPADPVTFSCAGRVLPGVELRFRDAGGLLDPVRGAMEVRSATMASGYFHRPVEQAANFVDGWYHPGDLGHLDEQGLPARRRSGGRLRRDRRPARHAGGATGRAVPPRRGPVRGHRPRPGDRHPPRRGARVARAEHRGGRVPCGGAHRVR